MATPLKTEIRSAGSSRPRTDDYNAAGIAARMLEELNALGETPREIARSLTARRMSLKRYLAELLYEEGEPWIIRDPDLVQPTDIDVRPDVIVIEAMSASLRERVYIKFRPGLALELFLRHIEDPRYYAEYTAVVRDEPAFGYIWASRDECPGETRS